MQWLINCVEHTLKLDHAARYLVKTNEDKWGANAYSIRTGAAVAFTTKAFRTQYKKGHRGQIEAFALIDPPNVPAMTTIYNSIPKRRRKHAPAN